MLTKAEKEVLELCREFLTPQQIARRRKCSHQAIYNILNRLKEKGAIDITHKPTHEKQRPQKIRLHGQEFNIRLLWKDHKYDQARNKSNIFKIDGTTVKLNKNSLEIYGGQTSFYADDAQKATSHSMLYWNKFFNRLEHELNIIIKKPRAQNIKLVNAHYAETNNELATKCNNEADKIRVYTTDTGKLWFTIDNSFQMNEAETLHPETSQQDMQEAVQPFFNDLRDNRPPTLSQVMHTINELARVNKETAAGLNSVATYIQQQMQGPQQQAAPENTGRPEYIG